MIRPFLLALLLLAFPGRAEVPPEQALGLYAHTLPQHRDLSPLWGMVALKSGVLANLRFYGAYGSAPGPGLVAYPRAAAGDAPLDAVSAVIQYLFPSPDRFNLTHNEDRKDPIGQIAREEAQYRTSRGEMEPRHALRKILALLDATRHYKTLIRSGTGLDGASKGFQHAVVRILGLPGKPGGGGDATAYDRILAGFAPALQRAVLEEARDARGDYPDSVVEVALLAYAWRVADSARELYAAFGGDLLEPLSKRDRKEDLPAFSAEAYRHGLEGFRARLGGGAPVDPEEAALFLYGFQAYDSVVPDLLPFRSTRYGSHTFPDCGETSLRNFFNCALCDMGTVSPARLDQVLRPGMGGAEPQLRAFFTKYRAVSSQLTEAAHAQWAAIVSGLNHPGDPVPITYRTRGLCQVQGTGPANMLNLIAHLIPDPFLRDPWPPAGGAWAEAAGTRFDQLCHLISQPDREFTWSVDGANRFPETFDGHLFVDFAINGAPAFRWRFEEGHFLLEPRPAQGDDPWPTRVAGAVANPWLRAWSAHFETDWGRPLALADPFEVFSQNFLDLGFSIRALEAILDSAFQAKLAPTFQRIVARAIPFDVQALDLLGDLRGQGEFRKGGALYPVPALLGRPQVDRDRVLLQAAKGGAARAVGLLLDHGASVEAHTPLGETALLLAAGGTSVKAVEDLLKAGANPLEPGPGGRTPLQVALGNSNAPGILAAMGRAMSARKGTLSPAAP